MLKIEARGAFVIFTCMRLGARRRNVNAREARKKFNPWALRIWIRSNCTPKSLKLFRGKQDVCPCRMTLALTLQRKNKEALGRGNQLNIQVTHY